MQLTRRGRIITDLHREYLTHRPSLLVGSGSRPADGCSLLAGTVFSDGKIVLLDLLGVQPLLLHGTQQGELHQRIAAERPCSLGHLLVHLFLVTL